MLLRQASDELSQWKQHAASAESASAQAVAASADWKERAEAAVEAAEEAIEAQAAAE